MALTVVSTPITFTDKYSCGISSTRTVQWAVSGKETTKSAISKRVRPQGVELLFSPTYLNRRSRWFVDGSPFNIQSGHYCWHGNGVYKYATCLQQRVLSEVYGAESLAPGYPSGFPWPSDTELLLAIKDQKVNLGMMVAEYKETAKMFEQLAASTYRMYRDIRSGKALKLLAKGSKAAPDTWMMYRYGLTPLSYDVKGVLDLANGLSDHPLVKTFKIRKKDESVSRWSIVFDGVNAGYAQSRTIKQTTRIATVEYLPIQAFSSMGLTNPFLLAWEVIPYSFVVDWFIGIGDYLSSLDALIGVKRVSNHTVFRGSTRIGYPNGATGIARSYERVVGGALSAQPPRWEPSLTWKRLVDSTVLLRNIRR